MNIHLRTQSRNSEHERLTLFINGRNSGELCMSPREAANLTTILAFGCAQELSPSDEIGQNTFERTERAMAAPVLDARQAFQILDQETEANRKDNSCP